MPLNQTERELLLQQGADIKELIKITSAIDERVRSMDVDRRERSMREKAMITGAASFIAAVVGVLKDVVR